MIEAREIQKIFTIYQNGKFRNIFLLKILANDLKEEKPADDIEA